MRRFEFVEGSSAKFWAADIDGQKFIVVYGKIGTAGTRKEKDFPTAEAAYKEYEKKVNEKVREGYQEVSGDGAAPPPPPPTAAAAPEEKREAKKAGPPPWPPRVAASKPTAEAQAKALGSVRVLGEALGMKQRSWRRKLAARRARQALARLGGGEPRGELGEAINGLLGRVGRGKGKLSLLRALDLLWTLDIGAYQQALAAWRAAPEPPKTVQLLGRLADQISEPELAFRLGCLLVDRPGRGISGNEAAWGKLWREVAPHLQAHLTQQGTTLRKFLATIETAGDAPLAARVARLKEH